MIRLAMALVAAVLGLVFAPPSSVDAPPAMAVKAQAPVQPPIAAPGGTAKALPGPLRHGATDF